jgi:hypothetical protein
MKTSILAMTVALFASSAVAEDFDNTVTALTVGTGDFNLKITGDQTDGYTGVEGEYTALEYSISETVDGKLSATLGYADATDEISIAAKYTLAYVTGTPVRAYASAEVVYVTPSDDLGDGEFYLNPVIGAGYVVADGVEVFTEVASGYNTNNTWTDNGVNAQLGMNWYAVPDKVRVSPSVVYNFDSEETQASLSASISF